MGIDSRDGLDRGTDGGTLVVVLHGLRGSPLKMAAVTATVRATWPDATIFCPRLPYAFPLTAARPELIAAKVVDKIDGLMQRQDHARIVLVGHSMGSLIARKATIIAHGETADAPFEPGLEDHVEAKPWAGRIDRLVMLAGMARGWSLNAAANPVIAAWWAFLILIGDIFLNGRWTLLRIRQGAPFIVQTRLQWLALTRRRREAPIQVVQLLGSQDDTVAPDDTIDFAVDLTSDSFVLIELPHTNHPTAIAMDDAGNRDRKWRFMAALRESPAELRALRDARGDPVAIPNSFAVNGAAPDGDPTVTDVVFVIHGIRDRGFWTRKIARKIMERAADATATGTPRKVRAMTLSYGYLAMVPFVLPWVRRAKVRWMMDSYAEWRALYPNADFSYVGHSNGTYLAARALEDYPAARFRRIVFAGSVVRRQYDWHRAITGKWRQVDAVLNYVASKDWVVAIFPNGLSRLKALDLGSAGHHGFDQLAQRDAVPVSGARISCVTIGAAQSHQIDYVAGGHGAGIRESQWDDIARFVVDGLPPQGLDLDYVPRQASWAIALGWLPPLSLGLILGLVIGLGAALFLFAAAFAGLLGWIGFGLYLLLLYVVITRL
ncbi:MAG: hypothetical protein WC729_06765 [Sphingomonas sp.]|jgi:alpha-beta hydrolase superfamily lysophospholipase|uniref:lipase family alpha/beta hydrolase n=1 Tax=Sphingomonas sp. TaxID=28214 RepID=UPI0035636DD9